MKQKYFFFISQFLLLLNAMQSQQHHLNLIPGIVLPKDSLVRTQLITSLDSFLLSAQKANEENQFVFDEQKAETFVLLDEIKDIGKSKKYADENFYKAYLNNVIPLNNCYLVQVSYIGTRDSTSFLRLSFDCLAYATDGGFVFSSPLKKNTANWKSQTIGHNTFYFRDKLDKAKAKAYCSSVSFYDKKLQLTNQYADLYCCEDLLELQRLLGITYKLDYNSRNSGTWSAAAGIKKVMLFGSNSANFSGYDPHDLWHARLSLKISRAMVNKPVDEGCAYLYGGSWGLSWEEIFKTFKDSVATNKSTDWKRIKEVPHYFKTGEYSNNADYVVNALIVKKIEKEKGFDGVWELLNAGKFEKGNEKYYQIFEKLTGITKTNYNEKVWELIEKETKVR